MARTPPAPVPAASARPAARRRRRSRGQSLAEFALTFPMALLMVLFGLDFGRVFLGWVALNNAARQAANYAAMNPTAWTAPYNIAVQSTYTSLVTTEAANINCTLATPVPAPSFPSGTSIGAPASVKLQCSFSLITPLIGVLTGNPIALSAYSAFPVRAGLIEGVPVPSASPTPSPGPSSDASASPTASVAPTVAPTPDPSAAASVAPTPAPCTVISLINDLTSKAQSDWQNAGFTGLVVFTPLVPPHYRIAWQSLTAGTSVPCTSGITVRSTAP